jgi:hypothetical protein
VVMGTCLTSSLIPMTELLAAVTSRQNYCLRERVAGNFKMQVARKDKEF